MAQRRASVVYDAHQSQSYMVAILIAKHLAPRYVWRFKVKRWARVVVVIFGYVGFSIDTLIVEPRLAQRETLLRKVVPLGRLVVFIEINLLGKVV